MKNSPNLYLAAPLFNERELAYNKKLQEKLSAFFSVFLPQEDGLLLRELLIKGIEQKTAERIIFDADIQAMRDCDIVLAILDGAHIDEGVSFELGFMYAQGKRCIGLQTDSRRALISGNNPMIGKSCEKIFSSEEELIDWCSKNYKEIDSQARANSSKSIPYKS